MSAIQEAGRNVIVGDAADPDFWERVDLGRRGIVLVMLAMSQHAANVYAARRLTDSPYTGMVGATAQFDDQVEELRGLGVDI